MEVSYFHLDTDNYLVQDFMDDITFTKKDWFNKKDLKWIDISSFDIDELTIFLEGMDMHHLIIENATNKDRQSRVGFFGKSLYIEFPALKQSELDSGHIIMIAQKDLLITIHSGKVNTLQLSIENLQSNIEVYDQSPLALIYYIMDSILDQTLNSNIKFKKISRQMSNEQDDNPNQIDFTDIITAKKNLRDLSSIAEEQLYCIGLIRNLESKNMELDQHKVYFMQLYTSIEQCINSLNRQEDRLKDVHYNQTLALHDKSARRLKFLTLITAIFQPLFLVTGIYGMNFEDLPGLKMENGYLLIMVSMIFSTLLLVWFFHKRDWFK